MVRILKKKKEEMVRMGKACEECARNCQLMHWNKMDLSPRVERFFKVMIGPNYSEVLFLPHKFAHTVKDLVDRETKLEDSNGSQWTVTVSSFNGSLALREGWHDFSVNHNLELGDFLIFNYIKGAHFVVHIYGRNCCEKINTDKNNPPSKRARNEGNVYARVKPCEKAHTNATNKQRLSTSVVSGSNLENSHIQPTTQNGTPDSEGGNGKWSCLDSSFNMMIDRDTGPDPGEDRMCFFDLSTFEMQEDKQAVDIKKGIDVEEGTSNKKHTSMGSQAEADKDPIGTEDLNLLTFTKETDVNMIENDINLEPKDGILVVCEKVLPADLSHSLPIGTSCKKIDKERDNMSNVDIKLQNAERSNGNYGNDWSSPYADKGASFIDRGQEFTGDIKKTVKKEQPRMRQQARSRAKRLRGLEPSKIKERGSSAAASYVGKPVKLEPVDSLDMTSAVFDNVTCLAVTDGRHCLELPAQLPAITFRGNRERKGVLLQDQERRFWPALYYGRSGLYILTSVWDKFNKENGVQAGDQYIFKVEDVSECIYTIDILRQ